MRSRSSIIIIDRITTSPLVARDGATGAPVVSADSGNIVTPLLEQGAQATYLFATDEGQGFDRLARNGTLVAVGHVTNEPECSPWERC